MMKLIREGLFDRMKPEQRPEGSEGGTCLCRRKSIPARATAGAGTPGKQSDRRTAGDLVARAQEGGQEWEQSWLPQGRRAPSTMCPDRARGPNFLSKSRALPTCVGTGTEPQRDHGL